MQLVLKKDRQVEYGGKQNLGFFFPIQVDQYLLYLHNCSDLNLMLKSKFC